MKLHGEKRMANPIFDRSGHPIPPAFLKRRPRLAQIPATPETDSTPQELAGTWWFGGYAFGAYGHMLTEGIARLWAPNLHHGVAGAPETEPPRIVFVDGTTGMSPQKKAAFRDLIAQFLPEGSVIEILGKVPVRFERLYVPDAALEYPFDVSPAMHITLGVLQSNINVLRRTHGDAFHAPERLYCSRSRLQLADATSDYRNLQNEPEVEALFAKFGFETVHPQDLSLTEQILIHGRAREMAGCNGSGLHNVIFANQCERMVQIYTAPRVWGGKMQMTLAALRQFQLINLRSTPVDADNRNYVMDLKALRDRLRTEFGSQGAQRAPLSAHKPSQKPGVLGRLGISGPRS